MPDYYDLYIRLFDASTQAIDCLETGEWGTALRYLKKAMEEIDEIYDEEMRPLWRQ